MNNQILYARENELYLRQRETVNDMKFFWKTEVKSLDIIYSLRVNHFSFQVNLNPSIIPVFKL